MAIELFRWGGFPGQAASEINAGAALRLASSSATQCSVLPISTSNVEPLGVALATAGGTYNASVGGFQLTTAVPVVDALNTIKVSAIASLGVGCDIGVASTNGGLAPVAGASGSVVWRVGKAVSAAGGNGEVFGLYVSPRQLSGEP